MPTQSENKLNQCQGCQDGWLIRELSDFLIHEVAGGYEGEFVVCTKDLYTDQLEADNA